MPSSGQLQAVQSSVERFNGYDLTNSYVIDGTSRGSFSLVDVGDGTVIEGTYKLAMTNSADCQFLGAGRWRFDMEEEDDEIEGHGKITSCLNWSPSLRTFVGTIALTGVIEIDD